MSACARLGRPFNACGNRASCWYAHAVPVHQPLLASQPLISPVNDCRVGTTYCSVALRPPAEDASYADLPLAEATDAFQREHIERAIARAGRNMSDAAKLLGLHRPNLYRKMKLLGMDVSEVK